MRFMGVLFGLGLLTAAMLAATPATAADDPTANPRYRYPVIKEYGGVVHLPDSAERPNKNMKVQCDITSEKTEGEVLMALARVALLINLYADAGIKSDEIKVSVVLHGPATKAALGDDAYAQHTKSGKNPNLELIRRLKAAGVEVYACGQALAHHNYGTNEVAPEVTIAASAATVNINKQLDGYAYLPFH